MNAGATMRPSAPVEPDRTLSSRSFIYAPAAQRIVFRSGALADLSAESQRLGLSRMLLLTTPGQSEIADKVSEILGERLVGRFDGATMHTPVKVTETACGIARSLNVDGLVAVGGGSTIGLSKAIALRMDLPQIAVPTTYAGSEMTDLIGQTEDRRKQTTRSEKVRPEVVLYDVDLTVSLPTPLSLLSGMNAIAHAVEALYAPDANPITMLMACEGIGALMAALPRIHEERSDIDARSTAQYGAWLCGTCLGSVTMGLHHKLCHVLGGMFDLPHAELHTVLLPYSLAYNAPAAGGAMARLRTVMDGCEPAAALRALQRRLGAPASLSKIGMPASGVEPAILRVVAATFPNPRRIEPHALRTMLQAALTGADPAVAYPGADPDASFSSAEPVLPQER